MAVGRGPNSIDLQVRFRDLPELLQAMKQLTEGRYVPALKRALLKTGFDMRDAVSEHASNDLPFNWRGGAKEFIAGQKAFLVLGPKRDGDELTMKLKPKPRAASILVEHVDGRRLDPNKHLTIDGMFAVPVSVPRGRARRPKIPPKRLPRTITDKGGKGFRRGRAILERTNRGGEQKVHARLGEGLLVSYALVRQPVGTRHFKFFEVAKLTYAKNIGRQMQRQIAKLRSPNRGR